MEQLSTQVRDTRRLVDAIDARDLRRGFTLTLLVLLGAAWLISLLPLVLIAHRVSRPIQQLTAALTDFAGGDWSRRLETGAKPGVPPRDEVARAVDAFNHMADQLEENRERLVHLTRMASWQSLARKTAHELKNSLTPIRLTVEEMQARHPASERAFMDQAVQIVVSEIESLERRVRAFSEFASEPLVRPEVLDINAVVTERVALLRPVHPGVTYHLRLDDGRPRAHAAPDMVNGILTNLLQNAAEAAGPDGAVVVLTRGEGERVLIDVHDSGPGLSEEVSATLFEPTITLQEARDGARPLHRQEERAAVGRGRHGNPRGAWWRRVQSVAAVMTRKRHIVIVDDEANIGRSLRLILEGEGYRVSVFDSTAAFLAERNRAAADMYLLDVRLPDGSGIDLLRLVRQWDERSAAVMISGHGTVADAVEATRIGAFDFLEKPLARDRVLLVVKNALQWSDLQRENQRYRELVGDAPRMIGSAPRVPARRAAGDAGGAIRRDRAAVRRVRYRQGAAGRAHPPRKPVCSGSVRESQLRRDPDRTDRERAVRP